MKRLNLDYLQPKTAKGYTYYAIPKPLIDDPAFDGIDLEAKFLYCQMVERVALSASHADDYMDEEGKLYIIYTVEEVMQARRCSKSTAVKWIDQLDKLGLIEKRRRGQGKPTIIYVKNFASALSSETETLQPAEPPEEPPLEDPPESFSEQPQDIVLEGDGAPKFRSPENGLLEVQKIDFKKSKNWTSRSLENEPLEVQKVDPINKDLREIDLRDPPSPPTPQEAKEEYGWLGGWINQGLEELEKEIKINIQYDALLTKWKYKLDMVDEIVSLIKDMLCRSGPLSLGGGKIPESAVRKRMWELEYKHIDYVLNTITAAKNIKNPRAYLLTLLYNAPISQSTSEWIDVNNFFSQA